jgi:hypothetical protein
MNVIAKFLILALLFQITGCAAMFHGTNDQVTVVSTDPDAKLFVDDFYVGKGSGTVTLHRNTTHTVFARKRGCADGITQTHTSFDAVSLLGILIDWGVISMLVVDWGATGAMWKTDPLLYSVAPNCPEQAVVSAPMPQNEMTAVQRPINPRSIQKINKQEFKPQNSPTLGSNCRLEDRGFSCRE